MTLAEFLLARIAEDKEAERERYFLAGIPQEDRPRARQHMSKTVAWKWHELGSALRGAGWALAATWNPPAARRRAAMYADHPDYRWEWKP